MASKRIIAVHLLNDWSGSPLVFRQALEVLRQTGFDITLYTATPAGTGFLSNLEGVKILEISYKWYPTQLLTLWNYLRVQLSLFLRLLLFLRPGDCVYVNTLLPFGAALAGWLRGCRVVYHVHEVSIQPRLMKVILTYITNRTAQEVLFVSAYTLKKTALTRPVCTLIYNAVPEAFVRQAAAIQEPNTQAPFTALMICSMKAYKGIYEFVAIARMLPHIRFLLVLNADEVAMTGFVQQVAPPANCFIFPAQTDTLPFYQQAHIVLNLSRPDSWVETFGMTVLEAMTCGRPVIVPTIGGICELIDDGKEGYQVDACQSLRIIQLLRRVSSDIHLYMNMAQAARRRATFFSSNRFQHQIAEAFSAEAYLGYPLYIVEKNSRIRNAPTYKPSKLAS